MKGTFVVSLDFELHWGGFEKWPLEGDRRELDNNEAPRNQYFLNTRNVIPKMLALFRAYEIHVTWAAVGMLLHDSKQGLLANAPSLRPTYGVPELSAYHYIETVGIGADEINDPFHFAPSLVKQIIATPNQELGTHTFAHYYCNEAGQTLDQFREDLRAAQRVARNYGKTLRSLVFPRNQFNDDYLKVCFEEGISSVRSNPIDWFWNIGSTLKESYWKRLNRGVDAYFPMGRSNDYSINSLQVRNSFPVCIPASRLLRPYNPRELFLNQVKVATVKAEMTRAAQRGNVYHLWWHPHNFGNYPEQSLRHLEEILLTFAKLRETTGMRSQNMQEVAQSVSTKGH